VPITAVFSSSSVKIVFGGLSPVMTWGGTTTARRGIFFHEQFEVYGSQTMFLPIETIAVGIAWPLA
jgi:hypothetical protein